MPALEPMAKEYAEHGISFVFIYTREAHPSDEYPAHNDFQQKLLHAQDMVNRWGIERPMLVDDLEGTAHRAFGTLPNMTYILAAGGNVIYRADWTDERTIRTALDQILFEREHRRAGTRVMQYYVEWLPQRPNSREVFMDGLLEIGERAVREFIEAVDYSDGESAGDALREWQAKRMGEKPKIEAD